jgi:hypothetical protein
MERKNENILILIFRVLILSVCIVSITINLILDYEQVLKRSNWLEIYGNTFSTFTIQSNLFVALWLFVAIIFYKIKEKPVVLNPVFRGAVTLYVTVTFLIYAIILEPIYSPQGWALVSNIGLHYIVPIAFIVDWLITETSNKYKWKYILLWLIYPIMYLIYTLIRGYFTGFYPYPFLNLNDIDVSTFIFNVLMLTVLFILLGVFYVLVNHIIYRFRKSK